MATFTVHFSTPALDRSTATVEADNADEARAKVRAKYEKAIISKVKARK